MAIAATLPFLYLALFLASIYAFHAQRLVSVVYRGKDDDRGDRGAVGDTDSRARLMQHARTTTCTFEEDFFS